jgi:hypothetical protein
MPIRINLMAEAQAAAELRRRDPVKRSIWIGSFLVCLILLWIANLQITIFFDHGRFTNLDKEWNARLAKYSAVTNDHIKTVEIEGKLQQLDRLSTNRFLWAPVLNALQRSVVDQVQVTHLRGTQEYHKEDAHDVGSGLKKTHVPASVVEKVSLSIEAKDMNPEGQNYTKFKESLGSFEYFAKRLGRKDGFTMDGILGPLTADPVDPSKQFVTFTLASHFPEIRRDE